RRGRQCRSGWQRHRQARRDGRSGLQPLIGKVSKMSNNFMKPAATALALSLGLALSACGGQPTNRSLDSIKQPVVERQHFTLDVRTGGAGLSVPEQRRVLDWFE